LTRVGGFTEAMKVASLAVDRGLPLVNHGFTTYINVAAALHFLNSIPNSFILEFVVEEETTLRDFVTRQKIEAHDGYLDIPSEPGLGVELNEEAIQKYRVHRLLNRGTRQSTPRGKQPWHKNSRRSSSAPAKPALPWPEGSHPRA
jgi:L-alanine-DL-glutamate epimerase-like enolase superfamily enzyme